MSSNDARYQRTVSVCIGKVSGYVIGLERNLTGKVRLSEVYSCVNDCDALAGRSTTIELRPRLGDVDLLQRPSGIVGDAARRRCGRRWSWIAEGQVKTC